MAISIVPYRAEHMDAVRQFNQRLREGNAPADYVFSETATPNWLPKNATSPVYNEYFLALEGHAVRGAFVLKHQMFSFSGSLKPLVYMHHPFSEGVVNRRYAQVGTQMLMRIVRDHPLLFALGMGGYDRPLPRMLLALKWQHCPIPFYFRVCRAGRFLREMQTFRGTAIKRLAADIAAGSGLGALALKAWQGVRGRRGLSQRAQAEVVREFDDWADGIWQDTNSDFSMIAVRDSCSLRTLYPAENSKLTRIRMSINGRVVGWAVVGILHRPGHEQYGDLRVGTILDALSRPEHAKAVIAAATNVLMDLGADLIGSNQSHSAWIYALKECGFLHGPSNFIFAAAPGISKLLEPFREKSLEAHLTRGDGDNLLQYV